MASDTAQSNNALDWISNPDTPKEEVVAEPVSGDVVLEGSLSIAEAETMHQSMMAVLDANVDISIASEDLSRVDAAGVQLIYAFVKEAKSRSISVEWKSVSDTLLETATVLDLHEKMGFAEQAA